MMNNLLFINIFAILFLSSLNLVVCQTKTEKNKEQQERLGPYQDSIYSFSSRLRLLDDRKEIVITNDPICETTTASKAEIIDKPNTKGTLIVGFAQNTIVKLYEYYDGDYWLISKDSIKGYVKNYQLNENEIMSDVIYTHKLERLTDKFDKKSAVKILNNQVWQGMSKDMALESRGQPQSKEWVHGYFGKRERWNYSNFYLVFENNFLVIWNNF